MYSNNPRQVQLILIFTVHIYVYLNALYVLEEPALVAELDARQNVDQVVADSTWKRAVVSFWRKNVHSTG